MKIRTLLLLGTFLTQTCFGLNLQQHPEVKAFVEKMVTQYHFNQKQLTHIFQQVHLKPRAIHAMKHPTEALPWSTYKKLYVTKNRIRNGVAYWHQHQDALLRAQKKYGVPSQIIVAIIGVETRYGANTGKYRVIDTLSTFAFNYPSRKSFFTKELAQFLLLCREQHWNPLKPLGSYAGALGLPQFMPSSYRHYAVDFNHDGKIDLLHNTDDVIGSVANYLYKNHWKENQAVAISINPNKKTVKNISSLISTGVKPNTTIGLLKSHHIANTSKLADKTPALLIELQGKSSKIYKVGLHNFYVISRYNPRQLYVMAVCELGQKIKHALMI